MSAVSVALACKGPLNARLATGVGLSFFLSYVGGHLGPAALGRAARRTAHKNIAPAAIAPAAHQP
jgi:hypothetical protein